MSANPRVRDSYDAIYDTAAALQALDREDGWIALDLETGGLSPWTDPIAVVSLYGQNSGASAVLHVRGDMPAALAKWLSKPSHKFITHNGAGFDMLFLANNGVDVYGPTYYDTMIGEACTLVSQRRDVRVNLQDTIRRRLGVSISKGMGTSPWMAPQLSDEQLKYCVEDIQFLPKVREAQLAKCDEAQARANAFEQRLAPVVVEMVMNGLPFSTLSLAAYQRELEEASREAAARLTALFGPINYNSPKQIKTAFETTFADELPDGLDSTDKLTMTTLTESKTSREVELGSIGQAAEDLLRVRESVKRKGMYSEEWIGKYVHNGRVHARFWQCGTDTGRFSSSEPNLQQVPRNGRKIFVAPPGYLYHKTDYCLDPATRVLCTDLTWKPIGEITAGATLVGFDEDIQHNPYVRRAEVTGVKRIVKRCYDVVTDRGTVRASEDHMWVARKQPRRGYGYTRKQWTATKDLTPGAALDYYVEPWETDTSRDAGYLAGFFDGEGYISKNQVGFGQNPGPVSERVREAAAARGFQFADGGTNKGYQCKKHYICGRDNTLRFLGSVRPTRLLPKASSLWQDVALRSNRSRPAIVEKIVHVGLQEVVAVETDTHTFIAEGFLSHNCKLEVMVAAVLSEDTRLLEDMAAGDLHTTVAGDLFRIPVSEVTEEQRKLAKAATFTLLFAGSASGLVRYARLRGSHLEQDEASEIVFRFFQRYRGLATTRSRARMQARYNSQAIIQLPTGLKRQLVGRSLKPQTIINTAVQGTAAAGLKHALLLCKERGYMPYIGAVVHDEILGTAPADIAHEVQAGIQEAMIDGMREVLDYTVEAEGKVGETWG